MGAPRKTSEHRADLVGRAGLALESLRTTGHLVGTLEADTHEGPAFPRRRDAEAHMRRAMRRMGEARALLGVAERILREGK